jgi:hypothetical protein
MMKNVILDISQNSPACNFLYGKEWTGRSWNRFDKPTFAKVAAKFPELVKPEGTRVDWGHGHYAEGADGMPKLYRSNFDSSN